MKNFTSKSFLLLVKDHLTLMKSSISIQSHVKNKRHYLKEEQASKSKTHGLLTRIAYKHRSFTGHIPQLGFDEHTLLHPSACFSHAKYQIIKSTTPGDLSRDMSLILKPLSSSLQNLTKAST